MQRLAAPALVFAAPALVFVSALATYGLTLCPSVYVEGSGELIGATYWLGTPHPTGYPLYALLGRLLAVALPLTPAAHAVNAATAIMAAAAAAALCALLRMRGCGTAAAVGAGLALAWSRTFWSQAVIAEVYGLFALAAIVVLANGLRARGGADRERWQLLTGYLAGLGVTTHLQFVLLLPWVLIAVLWPVGVGGGRRVVALIAAGIRIGLGLIAGVSLLLYLPVRNGVGPGFHWGPLDSWGQLWDHTTGALYRTSFFALPWPSVAANAVRLGRQLAGEWTALLLPMVVWGAVVTWRRDRVLCLVVTAAAGLNVAAALGYHRNPAGLDVFFLLTILAGCVFLGFGLDDVWARLRPACGPGLATAAVIGCALCVGLANLGSADRSQVWLPDLYGRQLLGELPADAVLLTDGDDASYVVDYLHRIEGLRPDVTVSQRLGRGDVSIAPAERRRREREWLVSGRSLHFLVPQHMPAAGYRFVPWGLSYRATAESESLSGPVWDPAARLSTAALGVDPWVDKLAANYWFMAAEGHLANGDPEPAAEAFLRAAEVASKSQSMNYNVALMLLRLNRLEDAIGCAMRAVEVDPVRRGPYRLAGEILARLGRQDAVEDLHKRARKWARFP